MNPPVGITLQDSGRALWFVTISTKGALQIAPDLNTKGAKRFAGTLDFSEAVNSSLLAILL
jgi:hypothetical protein